MSGINPKAKEKVRITWYSTVSNQRDHLQSALREFDEKLHNMIPELCSFKLTEMSNEDFNQHFGDFQDRRRQREPSENPNPLNDQLVVVFCEANEKWAEAARQENPNAVWGAAWPYSLALVYKPNNKYIIWHEALHLLGVLDCYDQETHATSCEVAQCIMQWVPTAANCDRDLFLCPKWLGWLTQFAAKLASLTES